MCSLLFRARLLRTALATIGIAIAGCGGDGAAGTGKQNLQSGEAGAADSGRGGRPEAGSPGAVGDAAAIDCGATPLSECGDAARCAVQKAWLIDTERKCAAKEQTPAACVPANALCLSSERCRFDTVEKVVWLFGSWCAKDEFTATLIAPSPDTGCQIDPLPPTCE